MKRKIAIIGSGFSGISAAAYAARSGDEVHVFEKNSSLGGRSRQFKTDNGYTFDMGPSWYWMPDIIENFFTDFNTHSHNYYDLIPLNPQFEMVFKGESVAIPEQYEELKKLFETIEKGASLQLDKFMTEAQYKYEVGMLDFVNKPCHSWFEFVSIKIARSALKMDLLTDFKKYVRRFFADPKLIALMEFPVLFLGAMPADIPALYSLMNYGGLKLGTWYPIGGFIKIIDAMVDIAQRQGVKFHLNAVVEKVNVVGNLAVSLTINGIETSFDGIISSADYHHTEQKLLEKKFRNYDELYWEKKILAPSCLIFYLGFTDPIPNLKHHTLFFENDFNLHGREIYKDKKWPTKPLFYACCPSKTDRQVAPENHENLFLLMPVSAGIEDHEAIREKYFLQMLQRIENHTGSANLIQKIDYKKSYCINDFMLDYNSYKGNAYGLANTLKQTAVLKPAMRNKKIRNIYYTGQLTVPGPGVPPSIISGKIAAAELNKSKTKKHEAPF